MILFHLAFFWSICVSVVFDDVVLREIAGTLDKVATHSPLVHWRREGGREGEQEQDAGKQQGPHSAFLSRTNTEIGDW